MTEHKHTPGPWLRDGRRILAPHPDADGSRMPIARVQLDCDVPLLLAAPDLLAACEALVLTTDCRCICEGLCNRCLAQVAIKKARGGA